MTKATTIQDTLRELAADAPGEHPSNDELLAYRAGRLAEDAEDTVRRHLVACSECVDRLLLLPTAREVAVGSGAQNAEAVAEDGIGDGGEVVDFEVVAARREIQARLRAGRAERWQRGSLAAAAVLLVAVGLSSQSALTHRAEVAALLEPQTVSIHDLDPFARQRGGEEAATVVEVPAGVEHMTVVLPVEPRRCGESYRAEILDAEGGVLWSRDGVPVDPLGGSALVLARRFLPDGRYAVRFTALCHDGSEEEIATFPMTLRYLGAPAG